MHQGWIKLHRKLLENPIFDNPYLLKLWIYCLMKATHKELKQLVGNQMVELIPGQFITGRHALSKEFNEGAKPEHQISPITLWRWLKLLEKYDFLNIKTTNKYSVVTINNWDKYQDNEQQMNNKRTTNEQQMNTNKNIKNDKNEKNNNKSRKRVYEDDSDEVILVNYFIEQIRKNDPKFKEPNKQSWADTFRKIIELDGRDKREIAKVIKWVQQHDFWKSNILSPTSLRKKYSTLIIQMNSQSTIPKSSTHQEQPSNYKQLTIDPTKGES